jgi:mannose-6-phosphate isomerase-like protein (cupin superfamily)
MTRDTVTVELYTPEGEDRQSPHTRDELYVVASGRGVFCAEGLRAPVGHGALIFVPAWAEHRFEAFTPDFAVWVLFVGPEHKSGHGLRVPNPLP